MGTEKAARERDVLSDFYDSHNLKRSAVCGDRRASAALALAGSPPEGFVRFDICSTPVPPPQLQKHCHQFYQDAHACGKFLKQVVTVHGGLCLRKSENAEVGEKHTLLRKCLWHGFVRWLSYSCPVLAGKGPAA